MSVTGYKVEVDGKRYDGMRLDNLLFACNLRIALGEDGPVNIEPLDGPVETHDPYRLTDTWHRVTGL